MEGKSKPEMCALWGVWVGVAVGGSVGNIKVMPNCATQ